MEGELDRLTEERDRALLKLTDEYGINATARALGISEWVMHKRIGRIRYLLSAVQHRGAA
jgi:hypothetical protein